MAYHCPIPYSDDPAVRRARHEHYRQFRREAEAARAAKAAAAQGAPPPAADPPPEPPVEPQRPALASAPNHAAVPAPADPPQPEEAPEAPPADRVDSSPDPAPAESPSPDPAAPEGPALPAGEADASPDAADEEAERLRVMREWVDANWDTVEAMALAGETPARPAPPPPRYEGPPPQVAPGDRWTKWKMAEFLRQLAATQSVSAAAKAVGMGRQSAYKLRSRLKGQPFDIAWEAAFRHGYDNLAHTALEVALEGEEVPHYHKGELVGTHRKHNAALIVQLLKMRNREGAPMLGRYGAAAEYWSEEWERMMQRVETGGVTWNDERAALTPEGRAALPEARQEIDGIVRRNLPDERPGRNLRK